MTIVEFLLARIAEDEAEIMTHVIDGHPTDPRFRQRPNGIAWDTETHHSAYFLVIDEERALAECAAKRAIVTEHETVPVVPGGSDTTCAGCGGAFNGLPCPTLAHLAAVYSTHPDYQTEWSVA